MVGWAGGQTRGAGVEGVIHTNIPKSKQLGNQEHFRLPALRQGTLILQGLPCAGRGAKPSAPLAHAAACHPSLRVCRRGEEAQRGWVTSPRPHRERQTQDLNKVSVGHISPQGWGVPSCICHLAPSSSPALPSSMPGSWLTLLLTSSRATEAGSLAFSQPAAFHTSCCSF